MGIKMKKKKKKIVQLLNAYRGENRGAYKNMRPDVFKDRTKYSRKNYRVSEED